MNDSPSSESAIEAIRERVLSDGVILCVRLGEGVQMVEACRAAAGGGLTVFEITLTTPGALKAIEVLSVDAGLTVGAGTALSPDDVRDVANAGGCFVLSPVFDPEVVGEAHQRGLLAVPGASTPTEILRVYRHGARLVKVFPAGALGGPGFLRAVRGPLPHVPLVPTNGPTAETIGDYMRAGAVAVGVGGEVFPPGFTLDAVEAAAARVRASMDRFREESDRDPR
jgi:2-dehydro-3-deoxyphosphogluconate aldolase/(4S)-4-hydroxy-2-oxoglutarate aldolase